MTIKKTTLKKRTTKTRRSPNNRILLLGILFVVCCFFCVSFSSFVGSPDYEAQVLFEQGDEYFKDEKFDKALECWKQAAEKGTIRLNRLEVKNDLAGMALNATIRLKLEKPEEVTKLDDFETHMEPVVKATLTIINLDKISPEPTVDQVQCDRAKAQVAAIDMSAEDAATQKAVAEQFQVQACMPHGGPLDELRPFIDPAKRVTAADGTTTDIINLEYDNNTLTVNGNKLK